MREFPYACPLLCCFLAGTRALRIAGKQEGLKSAYALRKGRFCGTLIRVNTGGNFPFISVTPKEVQEMINRKKKLIEEQKKKDRRQLILILGSLVFFLAAGIPVAIYFARKRQR